MKRRRSSTNETSSSYCGDTQPLSHQRRPSSPTRMLLVLVLSAVAIFMPTSHTVVQAFSLSSPLPSQTVLLLAKKKNTAAPNDRWPSSPATTITQRNSVCLSAVDSNNNNMDTTTKDSNNNNNNNKDDTSTDGDDPPTFSTARFHVAFGSEATEQQSQGVQYGGDQHDAEHTQRHAQRRALVDRLVAASEHYVKDERRQQLWGVTGNVTTAQDVTDQLQAKQQQELEEWVRQTKIAETVQGVTLDVLERDDESEVWDGDVQIMPGTRSKQDGTWYQSVDAELQDEWNTLMQQQQQGNGTSANSLPLPPSATRRRGAGVRVGSAGSWMLEVFPGDFVVHRKYGIGRFERTCLRPKTKLTAAEAAQQTQRRQELLQQKIQTAKQSGKIITNELIVQLQAEFGNPATDTDPVSNPQVTVLEIAYSDVVVHVPVDRAYRLSRYRAGDAVVQPKLSKARGLAWQKAKERVEENTLALAQDVLVLYAKRETLTRPPSDPTGEEDVELFAESFPYTPTPDQVKCFEDVENDMVWRKRPMDRLVCGDVGFGKTEVALRGLYRCVRNGRQAALLAPTGVLAAQHFKTVLKRLGPDTPFNVTTCLLRGGMSATSVAGRQMRESITNGTVQLIVGTHALLSKGLQFQNLGLLVIDEEQRFGVKQKERLKLICNGIDVLTLSATPIPRTLQMSLSGIRDTSTIRSPPPNRKPVITYVQDDSDSMVQKALFDELERGGQCYYVVPRISMLDDEEKRILRLFPDVRVVQAHGQMKTKHGAEENVAAFAEGQYDVLLATTVIENGVDIPSVNTIIVQNSQAFGMSTLYQLRGRVGRSDVQAYAYFLFEEQSVTEQAMMRLQAISELSELGSGFDIANRDLEIRGAGSLLGTEQSGLAAKVGFDLYMRMLKKSVRKLRGLDLPLVPRTNVLIPTSGSPGTFTIPTDYILDDKDRKTEESGARLAESTTALVDITNKWKKSYGPLPAEVQAQLKTLHLHACTRRLGIDLIGVLDNKTGDCMLRSPGLRPRHWAIIVDKLPRQMPPQGLDVVFPSRFSAKGNKIEINGGEKLDIRQLLSDESLSEDKEEEDWEAIDQEETEALNEISSAVNVKNLSEVDLEQYPCMVVKKFGNRANGVDILLKLLLPIAKVVGEVQAAQVEDAKTMAALREKQDLMKQQAKIRAKELGERSNLFL